MCTRIIEDIIYLIAIALFIFGIKKLSAVKTARAGNFQAALGMLLAIIVTLFDKGIVDYRLIVVGIIIGTILGAFMAIKVKMTGMPQLVGMLNGLGGLASALVSSVAFLTYSDAMGKFNLTTIILGVFVGGVTFTGSVIAYMKLQGLVEQQPVTFPLQKSLNAAITAAIIILGVFVVLNFNNYYCFWILTVLSLVLGVLLVIPIGGADMPVIISLLNSYSGIAGAMTGFVLMNSVLIVAGSLVGASGIILTKIMCKAMNRSLANVAFGAFGKHEESSGGGKDSGYTGVKNCDSEEAAMLMENAQLVIVVPGYGMAVSGAQHSMKKLENILEGRGITVKYAIHPVAGRMPGHMNVLLAEANIEYDKLYEMDSINDEFDKADVALVIGANDVINPDARSNKGSPIYGMPILNVDKAKSIIVIKRSLSPGFAGIKNPIFENEKTVMLFKDAKEALDGIYSSLKG